VVEERRNGTRVSWSGEVTAQVAMQRVTCHGIDLSESGMRVSGSWGAYPGQSCNLKFDLYGHTVHAFGVVVWAHHGDLGSTWGIRFSAVHRTSQEHIRDFVASVGITPSDPVHVGDETPDPTGYHAQVSYPTPVETAWGNAGVPTPVRTGNTVRVDVRDAMTDPGAAAAFPLVDFCDFTPPPSVYHAEPRMVPARPSGVVTRPDMASAGVDIRARHRAVVQDALAKLSRRNGPPEATPGRVRRRRSKAAGGLPPARQADSDPEVYALYEAALDQLG
jgi:hypothetical protein